MNVTQRLLALVALAVVGIVAVAVLATLQISNVFNAANFGNINVVPSVRMLGDLSTQLVSERVSAYRHLLLTDSDSTAKEGKRLAEIRASVSKDLQDYLPLLADDHEKELFDKVKALSAEYDQVLDEALVAIKHGDVRQAQALITGKMGEIGAKRSKVLDEQIAYNEKLSKDSTQAAVDEKSKALMLTSGITALVAVIAIVVGLKIARGITKPLSEVVEVAGHVANGNLAVRVDAGTGRDEISQLKTAIHKMVEQLRTTINEIVQGAQQISSLAAEL